MSERDKALTIAMGECWHELRHYQDYAECIKCNKVESHLVYIDFSTWEGFGKLKEFAEKQMWWKGFLYSWSEDSIEIFYMLAHPDRFADAVYTYLKGREVIIIPCEEDV